MSDNEPAIKALVNRVVQEAPGLTKRFAPQYSSKSLGPVGQAQQRLIAQVRALRLQTEQGYSLKLESSHPCYPWRVLHAT